MRGLNGRRGIPLPSPLGPYAATRLRHAFTPIPHVIGMCQQCFGWADDPRHYTRKA